MKFKRFFVKSITIFFVLIILLVGGCYIYAKLSPKLQINMANKVSFYDSNGELFFKGNEDKEWVSLKDISKKVIDATISVEDKNFYNHNGFDIARILKASYINVKNGKTEQGASTITQQYAKNLFLDFDKTWKRKFKEALYTMRLEANYSKDEILEGYLNTINYGHGVYGIENASKFYFNKSAKDLNLAEASMLVGIPKSPSNYSPLINLDLAKKRQEMVLSLMLDNNKISKKEKEEALNQELSFYGQKNMNNSSTLMYYKDAVINELKSIDSIPSSYIDNHGLKIYTNLDLNAQNELEKSIKEEIPDESKVQVASVMMKPENGRIIALVGGRDYNFSEYNRAVSAKRQVGSTMKPFLYYAALENGFTPSSSFISQKTTFTFNDKEKYSPQNYNEKYANKPISMATAIAYSDNIYAVKTNLFLGSDALINVVKRVGINEKLPDVPSLPLGTKEINIIDMTKGYSAFANLGKKVNPHLIQKIEDNDGKVLYEAKEESEQVLNSSLTFILNNMLTATYDPLYVDYNYPTAISLSSKLKHTYGLKSGTTETDNWHIGFNKDIITSVWVGYDDNTPLQTTEYKYGQNIWFKATEKYEENKDDVWYETPKNVNLVYVDPISGNLVDENAKVKKGVYFLKGSEPTNTQEVFDEKKDIPHEA